jgi:hypothetical protein
MTLGLCLAGGLLAGCGGVEGEAEDVSSRQGATTISPGGLVGANQYGTMWQPDMGSPVSLNSGFGTSCYLTSVWGKFASFSDMVQISWNGVSFFLGGSHGSGTPSADAFCQSSPGVFSGSWRGGQSTSPVLLGSAQTRSCFLTSLSGNFNSASAEIRLQVVNGQWQLDGTGAVAASAICVNSTPFPSQTYTASTGAFPVLPGSNGGTLPGALNTSPTGPYFCGLTGVKGVMVDKSWVGAYLFPETGQTGDNSQIWQWLLGGKNLRPTLFQPLEPLTGTAHCNF